MGIQINGATDSITAIDGTIDVVSAIGNAGVVTATAFVGNITGNVTGNINHASNLELQVGGVTRANIDSTGKVGINQSSPDYELDVTGRIGFTQQIRGASGSQGNPAYAFDGDHDTGMFRNGVNNLCFGTAGVQRLTIDENGKLGLGVNASNPSFQFQIHESVNTAYAANATVAQLAIGNVNSSSATNAAGIHLFTDGNGRGVVNLSALNNSTSSSADFVIQTRHSATLAERLRITSTGAVGIGLTNPEWKLAVYDADYTGVTIKSNRNTATANIGGLHFKTRTTNVAYIQSLVDGTIKFRNSSSLDERLRINHTGEVGINVTAASGNLLHIKTTTADSFAKIESESGYDAALLLDTSNGSGASADVRFQMDGSTKGSIQYVNNASSADANSMIFRTGNNSAKMQITTGGNIGIPDRTGTDFSLLDGMVINTANGSAGLIINSSSSSHNAYMSFGYGSGSGTSHADQYSAYIGRVGDNKLIFGTNNNIRASIDSNGNFNLGLTGSPAQSTTEQGVFLAGANSTQSVISSNVTPLAINRMGTGGNDRNCIEFRNNGSLKGTVGAVGVNNGIFFQSGVTEVMRITNDYKILVGLTTTGTSTSNNNLELAGTKMLKVGNFYIGYVIGTGNNGSGTLVLHKMGQNVGLQFSGMVTCHSYTGSAYLSGCIVVRYNTDAVTRDVTLQKAQSGMNFQIVSGTISGESGTYFGIKKNAGGTGSFYINAFVGGNIESYGGIREVSSGDWTTTTVHGSGIT